MTIDEYLERLDELFGHILVADCREQYYAQHRERKIKERYLNTVERLCDLIADAAKHPDYVSSKLLVQMLVERKSKWLIVLETSLHQYNLDKDT